jgi:hypothetical protein
MVAIRLASFAEARMARHCAGDLARAAGIEDAGAVEQAAGELGNNCVEHGNSAPGLLWINCKPGRLSLRFENPCEHRPDWHTRKPLAVGEFRSGGYGLPLARALAGSVRCRWAEGRVVIWAEFRGETRACSVTVPNNRTDAPLFERCGAAAGNPHVSKNEGGRARAVTAPRATRGAS